MLICHKLPSSGVVPNDPQPLAVVTTITRGLLLRGMVDACTCTNRGRGCDGQGKTSRRERPREDRTPGGGDLQIYRWGRPRRAGPTFDQWLGSLPQHPLQAMP